MADEGRHSTIAPSRSGAQRKVRRMSKHQAVKDGTQRQGWRFRIRRGWHWPTFNPTDCQECGRVIPIYEVGWLREEQIYCEDCYRILEEQAASRAVVLSSHHAPGDDASAAVVEVSPASDVNHRTETEPAPAAIAAVIEAATAADSAAIDSGDECDGPVSDDAPQFSEAVATSVFPAPAEPADPSPVEADDSAVFAELLDDEPADAGVEAAPPEPTFDADPSGQYVIFIDASAASTPALAATPGDAGENALAAAAVSDELPLFDASIAAPAADVEAPPANEVIEQAAPPQDMEVQPEPVKDETLSPAPVAVVQPAPPEPSFEVDPSGQWVFFIDANAAPATEHDAASCEAGELEPVVAVPSDELPLFDERAVEPVAELEKPAPIEVMQQDSPPSAESTTAPAVAAPAPSDAEPRAPMVISLPVIALQEIEAAVEAAPASEELAVETVAQVAATETPVAPPPACDQTARDAAADALMSQTRGEDASARKAFDFQSAAHPVDAILARLHHAPAPTTVFKAMRRAAGDPTRAEQNAMNEAALELRRRWLDIRETPAARSA